MELPILQNDLRSSGSWATALAEEQKQWTPAQALGEGNLRDYQVEQTLKTFGEQVDRARLTAAANQISAWAKESGGTLDAERLLELHRTLTGAPADADVLRRDEPTPINAAHDPTPAVLLPRMIDHAFDWFSTESFGQLHAVEQAAVVYLRLLDLYPFPTLTRLTSLLAASFYTERAGLPPLIVSADEITLARFDQAMEAAMRMLTQPLVELFAEILGATMRHNAAAGAPATG